jgi:hypothetical protein
MEFKPRKKLYAQESAGNRPNKVIRIYTPVYNRLAALAESHRWTITDVASRLLEKTLDEYSAEKRSDH